VKVRRGVGTVRDGPRRITRVRIGALPTGAMLQTWIPTPPGEPLRIAERRRENATARYRPIRLLTVEMVPMDQGRFTVAARSVLRLGVEMMLDVWTGEAGRARAKVVVSGLGRG
jgi:hypothetical protein